MQYMLTMTVLDPDKPDVPYEFTVGPFTREELEDDTERKLLVELEELREAAEKQLDRKFTDDQCFYRIFQR